MQNISLNHAFSCFPSTYCFTILFKISFASFKEVKVWVIAFADGKIENSESKDHLDYEEKI